MHQRAPSLAESYLNNIFHLSKIAVSFAMLLPLIPSTTQPAQAQTYQVLHYFTSGADGAKPIAGATVGGSGILYGTAPSGGTGGYGTAYKLTQHSSSWVFSPLYEFTEGGDGVQPVGGVVVGSSGALYGTAVGGGSGGGGTVFELRPPFTICRTVQCYWTETTLYSFSGAPSDG
ncbi:MAG: choice-of-anchor tandem repeat GloVer-containing protein, partial [Candidatus Korobacteraceae bacterium]